MKSLKAILWVVFVALLLIVIAIYFAWNKPTKDIARTKPDYTVSARDLYGEFTTDENEANLKYLNKIVEVHGRIAEVSPQAARNINVILRDADEVSGVSCSLTLNQEKDTVRLKIGNNIKIKGLCSGLSLMDVELTRCSLVE
jgi:hypothetical protein